MLQKISLGPLLSKRKLLKFEKHIKALEREVETLSKLQNYSYKILMTNWAHNQVSDQLSEITLCLYLASFHSPVYCRSGTIIEFNEIN